MRREIEEEVELGSPFRESIIGLINDDETEVGRVHLGVVHVFELDEPRVTSRETSLHDFGFAAPRELAGQLDEFESWSQICLRQVAGGVSA